MSVGVIIARFQTPYLHEGHIDLIDQMKAKHNKCLIVLGVSQVRGSSRSPYDYYTREKMIKDYDSDLIVLPVMDKPSDKEWSTQLDVTISTMNVGESFILYGSRDSFIKHYHGKYKTQELPEHGDYNATEIREKYKDRVGKSEDFRAGILYALNNKFPISYATVDIVLFKDDRTKILLGRKNDLDKLRFPGGFVDPTDDSYEHAAARELREECGLLEFSDMQYEMSTKIDDWRYRNDVDKIKTSLFTCDYIFGAVAAGDDLQYVEWVNVEDLKQLKSENKLNETHMKMFDYIIQKYDLLKV